MAGGGLGAIGPIMSLAGSAGGGGKGGGGGSSVPAISPQQILNEQQSYANRMSDLGLAGASWLPISEGDIANQAAVQNAQFGLQQQQANQSQQNASQSQAGTAAGLNSVLNNLNSGGGDTTGPGLSNTGQ